MSASATGAPQPPQPPPIYRELSAAIQATLNEILGNDRFADAVTLGSAYAQLKNLCRDIVDAPEAVPQENHDTVEEDLAEARRLISRLSRAPIEGNGQGDKVPDAPMFNGSRAKFRGFAAQLRLKLFSDPRRYPTPALRTAYAFNRLEDRALEQILPYVSEAGIALDDVEDLIRVLQNAFADPDAAATARERLQSLKQGNKEFSSYFAEFQMLIAELDWDQNAKMDALREGLSIELHDRMIGLPPPADFTALAALCQQLDSQIRAVEARRKRRPAGSSAPRANQVAPPTQPRTSAGTFAAAAPAVAAVANTDHFGPAPMDLSANRRKISPEERASRLREGRCLYCGGLGHMARDCPNKSRNPFRAAATAIQEVVPEHAHQPHDCDSCESHAAQSGKV